MSLTNEDREALAKGLRDGWSRRILDLPEDQWPCSDEEEVELVVPIIEQIIERHVTEARAAALNEAAAAVEALLPSHSTGRAQLRDRTLATIRNLAAQPPP